MLGAQGQKSSSPESISRKNRTCYHDVHLVAPGGAALLPATARLHLGPSKARRRRYWMRSKQTA
jgi:hypothetical protein